VVARRAFGVLALAAGLVPSLACGRRATEADCRLIVDKSVELQMKEMSQTSESVIKERAEQVRAELGDEIKNCEGRRITDRTVACVQAATTTRELDRCLR